MRAYLLIALLLAGCSSDHSSVRERQDDALRDPMNYTPDTTRHNDITGGGTADFKSDGMKKDLKSVFGP